MKVTKILWLLLAALMVSSSFASCAKKDFENNSSSPDVSDMSVEESSDDVSSEISEDDASEDTSSKEDENDFKPYSEDKSGYLKGESTKKLNQNSVTIKAKDFKGTFKDTYIDNNGRLTLTDGENIFMGTFESEAMNIGSFTSMLVSWNAVCGNGKMSVLVSYEAADKTWSEYFTFGTWSDKNNVSESKSKSTSYGRMNVDTFTPSKASTGNIKIKITLNKSGGEIPVIENITVANPEMKKGTPGKYPKSFVIDVPMRSQLAPENGADGGVMCSATTVAMALEHLGLKQTTYETAMGTYDKVYDGYGNWLFSVAEAASHGYYAYCDFYTPEMLKYALSQGCTIGCSTKLTSAGHVVLVTGYEVVDGVEYYVVNDPNVSPSKVKVTRYTCEYFNSVFLKSEFKNLGVVYVFQGQY